MRTIAIVQARMRSSRFPGKVLADIEGRPMLWHVVDRTRRAKNLDGTVVATSELQADDPIIDLCGRHQIPFFRGSEEDVLERYYRAAEAWRADVVVRITSDCPLMDPGVIDRVVEAFRATEVDFATNTLQYTYPDGLDVEVFSFRVLREAAKSAVKKSEREHVTAYMRNAGRFRILNVAVEESIYIGAERWTVDETSDLEFVRAVYRALGKDSAFDWRDVLELLERRPDIRRIQGKAIMNEGYYKTIYEQAIVGAAPKRTLTQSHVWFGRSKKVIPGCAQTFSKGYTQYVQGISPIFLCHGKGCRVWDVDENEYIDYVQGLMPNILGYAHDEVNQAAAAQLSQGHSFSLPHPLEVELAERLTRLIPCAEMIRFGKNGSDATSGAIRAARAYTKRDRIACCGYHGWQDWYIGSTTRHAGVPEAVRKLTHPFPYNDLPALENLLAEHPGEFAAVIMEPETFIEPLGGYLDGVKRLVHGHGALLIFDEICTGFHLGLGGAQKRHGVTPDLACFGKAMGNGFPISCVAGCADVMKVFSDIFFSFTFGGEVVSLAAAMKVLDILEHTDALGRMETNGRRLMDGFNTLASQAGLAGRFQCIGRPTWSLLKFRDAHGSDSFLERSLFQQEVVKRGILMLVTHNMTAAHDEVSTEQTLEAYAAVLKTLANWLSDAKPDRFLEGPIVQPVFRVRT